VEGWRKILTVSLIEHCSELWGEMNQRKKRKLIYLIFILYNKNNRLKYINAVVLFAKSTSPA